MKKLMLLFYALSLVVPLVADAGIENPVEVYSNVTPSIGSHYLTNNPLARLDVYSYKYSFDLKDLDLDIINRWPDDIVLGVEDIVNQTSNDNWILQNNNNLSDSILIFTVNFTEIFRREFLGEPKYRLYHKGKILDESKGPKIAFEFRNEKSEKKSNGVYNYSVEVRSSINNSIIYIFHEDKKGRWNRYDINKTYISNNSEWKLLKWEGAPYFPRLEFVPDFERLPNSNNQVGELDDKLTGLLNDAERTKLILNQTYSMDSANLNATYIILLKNMGDIGVKQINLSDILPANTTYIRSGYEHVQESILMSPSQQNNSDGTTTLTWYIGDLVPGQEKTIKLTVKYMSGSNGLDKNRVMATGSMLSTMISITSIEAIPA